jgi:cytidine deaminase
MDDALEQAARDVAKRAYAPYSRFHVGAAVRTAGGAMYAACNVENASFSLTLCAERNALAAMVAAEGAGAEVERVVVVALDAASCPPCGACRQVLAELAPRATVGYLLDGTYVERPVAELLPDTFTPGDFA